MPSPVFANVILVCHTCYVAIVVLSVPLIILGGLLKWRWVHNMWFRSTHLLMIAVVAAEAIFHVPCPLTEWERALRPEPLPASGHNDFIAQWLDRLLFWHFSHATFTAMYIVWTVIVLCLLFIVPLKVKR